MSSVDKISKLLNQAERADEGSPEREAFMEKALALSQAYSIDLAVARSHQAKKERIEEPERRSFKIGQHGKRDVTRKNAHLVDLMIAIMYANDVQMTIGGAQIYVHGTGMPTDLDMCERLFAILSVQMLAEADAGIKRGDHGSTELRPVMRKEEIGEDERAWGGHDGRPSGAWGPANYYDEQDEELVERGGRKMRWRWSEQQYRDMLFVSNPPPKYRLVETGEMEEKWAVTEIAPIWRDNFYQGFILRTQQRLREAKKTAMKDAGIDVADDSDERAIALRDKTKEVRDAFEENEKFVLATGKTYGGANVSRYSDTGRASGDAAGQRARLGNEKDLGTS